MVFVSMGFNRIQADLLASAEVDTSTAYACVVLRKCPHELALKILL